MFQSEAIMSSETISFPQRKILKNYRSVTGHFPSIKNNRSVGFESLLEKIYFLTLEFDDTVKAYSEQPQITIEQNGNPKTYSADCYVIYHQSSGKRNTIVEVKYESDLAKDRQQLEAKFKSAEASLHEMNMDFYLFTDATYSEVYIRNLDFLYRYKTFTHSNDNDSRILNTIDKPISAFELANSLAKNKPNYFQLANSIWALVANGHLDTNLYDQEITMNSIVWRNNERY